MQDFASTLKSRPIMLLHGVSSPRSQLSEGEPHMRTPHLSHSRPLLHPSILQSTRWSRVGAGAFRAGIGSDRRIMLPGGSQVGRLPPSVHLPLATLQHGCTRHNSHRQTKTGARVPSTLDQLKPGKCPQKLEDPQRGRMWLQARNHPVQSLGPQCHLALRHQPVPRTETGMSTPNCIPRIQPPTELTERLRGDAIQASGLTPCLSQRLGQIILPPVLLLLRNTLHPWPRHHCITDSAAAITAPRPLNLPPTLSPTLLTGTPLPRRLLGIRATLATPAPLDTTGPRMAAAIMSRCLTITHCSHRDPWVAMAYPLTCSPTYPRQDRKDLLRLPPLWGTKQTRRLRP